MIQIGVSSGSILQPLPQVISDGFGINGGIIGGGYVYSGALQEANQPPIITDIDVSGTLGVGNTLTITVSSINNTGYSFLDSECKVYRSTDLIGTSETLIDTITSNTNIFSYLQVLADENNHFRFEITLKLNGGLNPNSDVITSAYTDVVPVPPSPMDIMNRHDYRIYDLSNIDPVVSIPNNADASRPMTVGTDPAPNIISGAIHFDRANSESLILPHPATTEIWEAFIYWKAAAFGVTQNMFHLGSAVAFSMNSARRILVNGVDTGVDFPNDTTGFHLVLIHYNGASSNVTIDNGTPGSNFNSGNPTIGGADGHFARNSGGANHANGYLKYFGSITRTTTGTERTDVYNELLTK